MTAAPTDLAEAASAARCGAPATLWGLDPSRLHDLAWGLHGVQAVRRGSGQRVGPGPGRFVLLDRDECVHPDAGFGHAAGATARGWRRRRPAVPSIDAAGAEAPAQALGSVEGFRERVHLDDDGRFLRVTRQYRRAVEPRRGVRITDDRRVAAAWAADRASGADGTGRSAAFTARAVREGRAWGDGPFQLAVLRELSASGGLPSGVREIAPGVWAHGSAAIGRGARFIGPVWIGRGACVLDGETVVGPCVVPDGASCGQVLRDGPGAADAPEPMGPWAARSKRAFDVAASLLVLTLTLPISAVIVAAIWLQAGRPILFSNERQTRGGRVFRCLKFRTMRRDAERVKAAYARVNTCDGPQFHIPNDPRTFPVGRALRRCHLDELPQLINVLRGDMSIVGPRPSPDAENQCCPAWREARLSVRAGITGLWQVRCRRRPGTDFQEWIRYDLAYVRGWSWGMDVAIMCRTLVVAVRRGVGIVLPAGREPELRTPRAARYVPSTAGVVEAKPEVVRADEGAAGVAA